VSKLHHCLWLQAYSTLYNAEYNGKFVRSPCLSKTFLINYISLARALDVHAWTSELGNGNVHLKHPKWRKEKYIYRKGGILK
jgi:hypothetical protein